MMIVYFISSLFRRGGTPQNTTNVDGTISTALPAANIFQKDTLLVFKQSISFIFKFEDLLLVGSLAINFVSITL